MKFNELPFSQPVLDGISDAGFTDCTDVQSRILPLTLKKKDVMVQSKTGSGKTAVYLLTILQAYQSAKEANSTTSKALIVAPTRELAVQIEEDAIKLACHIEGITIGCFYGGVGYEKQDALLEKGCDLFVCTPGRILDYQNAHKIDFRQFDFFIVDEADRLFDMGFYPDIQKMFALLREKTKRQTMLFSATLGTKVQNLAWSYMNEPQEIAITPEEITVDLITQELYHISKDQKFGLFLQILAKENPENCLIFTNTKARCIEVAKRLTLNGFPTSYLMGDMPQSKRLATLDRMKEGKIKFLVATDVAARGLQIDDLVLVVNYDIPDDFESYVHRIGRTARAGKSGKAITFADEEYVYGLEAIEDYIKMKIPVIWPEEGDLPKVEDKSKNLRFRDLVGEAEYASHGPARREGRPSSSSRARRGKVPSSSSRFSEKSASTRKPRGGEPLRPKREVSPVRHKSYAQIQDLSLDERIAYYKSEYHQDEKGRSAAAATSRKPSAPVVKKGIPKKNEQPVVKKKTGFWSWLLGKKKQKAGK